MMCGHCLFIALCVCLCCVCVMRVWLQVVLAQEGQPYTWEAGDNKILRVGLRGQGLRGTV